MPGVTGHTPTLLFLGGGRARPPRTKSDGAAAVAAPLTRVVHTALAVNVGAESRCEGYLSQQPLGGRGARLARLALLVPALTLRIPRTCLTASLTFTRRSATAARRATHRFGPPVSAIHSWPPCTRSWVQAASWPVSCYAFIRGWLPLSLPPGHPAERPLPTAEGFSALACGLGCVPLDPAP